MSEAAPAPLENQGAPLPRVDGRLKVTGEARFAADVPLANLAHAVLVTSDVARGTVTSIDLEAARQAPAVLLVLSYGDAEELVAPKFGVSSYTSLAPLSQRKIWHDGQIVAVVVAETFQAAEEAATQVRVHYAAGSSSVPGESSSALGGSVA